MICKKCGAQIEDNSVFCKECGERLEEQQKEPMPKKKKRIIIISAAAAVLIIAGIVFGVLYTNYVKEQEKEVFSEDALYEQEGENYFLLTTEAFAEKFNYFSDGIKLGEADTGTVDEDIYLRTWDINKELYITLSFNSHIDLMDAAAISCYGDDVYRKNLPTILRVFCPGISNDEINKCLERADKTKVDKYDFYNYEDISVIIQRYKSHVFITVLPRK